MPKNGLNLSERRRGVSVARPILLDRLEPRSKRRSTKNMPSSRTELKDTVDQLEGTIQEVSDLVDEALDPELSREEVISKLKEIQEAVGEEEEEEPGE